MSAWETEPLLRAAFQHQVGIIAHSGVVTLTADALSFVQGRLERLAGAEPWSLPVADIVQITVRRFGRVVEIRTAEGDIVLSGKQGRLLQARLLSLRAERGNENAATGEAAEDQADFEPGEAVLRYGSGLLSLPKRLEVRGQVRLTSRYLRFEPSFLGRVLSKGERLKLPLEDIRGVKLSGVRRLLELGTDSGPVRIGGALAPRLFATLVAMRDAPEGTRVSSLVFPASLSRGLRSPEGLLVLTRSRLRFVTTGRWNAAVGLSEDLEVSYGHINRIGVRGRAVDVFTTKGVLPLEIPAAGRFLETVAPMLAEVAGPNEPDLDRDGAFLIAEDGLELCKPYKELFTEERHAEVKLVGPVVLHEPKRRAKRLYLVQTETGAVLLPTGGAKDREVIEIPYAEGLEPMAGSTARTVLVLTTQKRSRRLHPRTGNAFVRRFWQEVPVEFAEAVYVRRETNKEEERPADYYDRRDTFRVELTASLDSTLRVLSVPEEPLVAPPKKPGPKRAKKVEELPPEDRPLPDEELGPRPPDAGAEEELPFSLFDISAEGVGLRLETPLPLGAQLRLLLVDEGVEFLVQVRVVHVQDRRTRTGRFQVGCAVSDPDPEAREALQGLWTTLQRTEISRRSTGDELLDE